jgi:hypothetical protein
MHKTTTRIITNFELPERAETSPVTAKISYLS